MFNAPMADAGHRRASGDVQNRPHVGFCTMTSRRLSVCAESLWRGRVYEVSTERELAMESGPAGSEAAAEAAVEPGLCPGNQSVQD